MYQICLLSEHAINALKKSVKKILELNKKVLVIEEIKSLYTRIKKLTGAVNQDLSTNGRLNSDLSLQGKVFNNPKKIPKPGNSVIQRWKYNRQKRIEISTTSDSVSDDNLKDTISKIAKDIDVKISEMYIEASHILSFRPSLANVGQTSLLDC